MACPTGVRKVESKDPRINYNLLPGEKLETCPYNLSHAVLPIKFAKHVLNCHRLHCKEQKERGAEPLFAICQYDRSHHVRKEEIAFHESTCKAKELVDGWDTEEEDNGCSSSAMKSEASSKIKEDVKVVVELQKPPQIDAEAMEAIKATEDWEEEPTATEFNAEEHIHRLRLGGYNVIKTHNIVGLSKSEKKKFYQSEEKAFKMYGRVHLMRQMNAPAEGSSGEGEPAPTKKKAPNPNSSSISTVSCYGYEAREVLDEISEEN